MSGRVVEPAPPSRHRCDPGVTYTEIGPDSDLYEMVGRGARAVHPPSAYDYPPGTRWACDQCPRQWVATKRGVPENWPGVIRWRRYRPVRSWCDRHPLALFLILAALMFALAAFGVGTGLLA